MMTRSQMRLDDLLVERGMYPDRDVALRAILAGEVRLDTTVATSAGMMVPYDARIDVEQTQRYVSRGGLKLEGALEAFSFDPTGLGCLDAGASTGGFTDCLLQHGAARVCAVDVGYGQFAWSLRTDPRVALFERTNIRDLDPDSSGAPFDLAVADVSFAPLRSYLESVVRLLKPDGSFITLVKPQFEAAKSQVGARGVVSDPLVHQTILEHAKSQFEEHGLSCRGLAFSPITGPMGNIEYLLLGTGGAPRATIDVEMVVTQAHMMFEEGRR